MGDHTLKVCVPFTDCDMGLGTKLVVIDLQLSIDSVELSTLQYLNVLCSIPIRLA